MIFPVLSAAFVYRRHLETSNLFLLIQSRWTRFCWKNKDVSHFQGDFRKNPDLNSDLPCTLRSLRLSKTPRDIRLIFIHSITLNSIPLKKSRCLAFLRRFSKKSWSKQWSSLSSPQPSYIEDTSRHQTYFYSFDHGELDSVKKIKMSRIFEEISENIPI